MNNKDNGGSAFPAIGYRAVDDGMTLRDYFAAKAMQALIQKSELVLNPKTMALPVSISAGAYDYADAMLKERAI